MEIDKYKEKCKVYERKDRELNSVIKQLKDNIEKKKAKIV